MRKRVLQVERFPFGKRFAISLIDDTDKAVLPEIVPVYECLLAHGILPTKTVWPLPPSRYSGGYPHLPQTGTTLQDAEYRSYCQSLQRRGVEIAMHTASAGDSPREETIAAYDAFEDAFGHPPFTNIMHSRNRENIYWGRHAVHNRFASQLIAWAEPLDFAGHVPSSPYYWGDICRTRSRYVRQFETLSANTLRFDPATPYHDSAKPDVPWWFSASYGAGTRLFDLLNTKTMDALAKHRGAAIIHTYLRHFAWTTKAGTLREHPRLLALSQLIASRSDAWAVPVVTLLDRLRAIRAVRVTIRQCSAEICNDSHASIDALALRISPSLTARDRATGELLPNNAYAQIEIGTLAPGQSKSILLSQPGVQVVSLPIRRPNYSRLMVGYFSRIAWQFLHGRDKLATKHDPPWVHELQSDAV